MSARSDTHHRFSDGSKCRVRASPAAHHWERPGPHSFNLLVCNWYPESPGTFCKLNDSKQKCSTGIPRPSIFAELY